MSIQKGESTMVLSVIEQRNR